MNKLEVFQSLASLFKEHGFTLYLVGGTVRDYLLDKELTDLDVVSDATPSDVKAFFTYKADYTFEKYGNVVLYYENEKFDFTTLRIEKDYQDSRHPKDVEFIKELSLDVKRRDFTINALYMDEDLFVYDFVFGKMDLYNHTIRMIGDTYTRIKEDPLRILRAFRFAFLLSFEIEETLLKTIYENVSLLKKLQPNKIKAEINKVPLAKKEEFEKYLADKNIVY